MSWAVCTNISLSPWTSPAFGGTSTGSGSGADKRLGVLGPGFARVAGKVKMSGAFKFTQRFQATTDLYLTTRVKKTQTVRRRARPDQFCGKSLHSSANYGYIQCLMVRRVFALFDFVYAFAKLALANTPCPAIIMGNGQR